MDGFFMGKVSIGDVIDIIPKPISTIYHIYHIYIYYIYISIHIKNRSSHVQIQNSLALRAFFRMDALTPAGAFFLYMAFAVISIVFVAAVVTRNVAAAPSLVKRKGPIRHRCGILGYWGSNLVLVRLVWFVKWCEMEVGKLVAWKPEFSN